MFSNQEGLMYCYSLNGQLVQRMHEKATQGFLAPVLMKDDKGF